MLVKLRESGVLQGHVDGFVPSAGTAVLERSALLVYAGKFLSLDGEVTVTEAQLGRLVENHNAHLQRSMLASGDLPLKNCPPIQLDHTASARDTVGRLVGPVMLGTYQTAAGDTVAAIYGTARFLGAENCERVHDGRWIHLSVGADFDEGRFNELTVTPFPAAKEASLLGAQRLSENTTETTKPPLKETTMDKTKLKGYLTRCKKMSESEADSHLAGADDAELSKLSAEADADDKRLASEETEKKEKEEKEAKLAGQRANLTRLATDFRAAATGAQLAAKSGRIMTRLSALRASAKVTPAEIKKIDVTKLAAMDEAAIALVLKSYDDREPVIPVGQYGTTKAADLNVVGDASKKRLADMEAASRANMSLKKDTAAPAPGTRLSSEAHMTPAVTTTAPTAEDAALVEKEHTEIVRLMDGGDLATAKVRLKTWLQKTAALSGAAEYTQTNAAETEAQLEGLVKTIEKLQAGFNEVSKLAGEIAGITV